jgi:hypothetical protein
VPLAANGKSASGPAVNLNVPIPAQLSWGDLIATAEGGQVVLYCMAAANTSFFFKYNVNTATYQLIKNDLPTEMQIGVDINGDMWAGSLTSGMIQKINRQTGYFYGSVINFGGNIWDLTGPINCPQAVEICGNGLDDDHDGYTDNQDQDCLCPSITPNDAAARTICEGETLSFSMHTNAPNPPYSSIEFYRFNAAQANPYLSTDAKTWLGEFSNTSGNGSISSANFPNTAASANAVYYVYGLVKPAPQFPATCAPLAAYTVTVKPAATLSAGTDMVICSGTTANISATATNGPSPFVYNWSNGLGAGASKNVTPTANTTYTVTVTAANGCSTTDDIKVSLNPTPIVDAGPDVSVCNAGSTTLTATASNSLAPYTFEWDNGLGSGATKTVAPNATKTYTVTVTAANGCVATDQVKVTVNNCVENCNNGLDDDGDGLVDCADPSCGTQVEANDYYSICAGQQVTMSVSASGASGLYTFAWSHGLGTGQSKTVSPVSTTTYTVTVTPTAGCTSTRQIQVVVVSCPEDCSNGIDDDLDGLVDCDDPSCALVGAPQLVNDTYTSCPGMVFSERVTYNDGNLQDPIFSIYTLPSHGSVSIDGTGKFTYTPSTQTCGLDDFYYQVCNQTTGCCSQAKVTLLLGDTQPPVLLNMPSDLTISCDDAVPSPTQVLAYDACPGIYIQFDETTNEHVNGACQSFTITRTWTATDLCGNQVEGQQDITVQDLTAPEILRRYTLPNDKKLLAGRAELCAERWKYVAFPIDFDNVPVVLPQLSSEVEAQAAVVQLRNISTQGFEMRLMEQEASTGAHQPETVAWLAMEQGTAYNTSFALETGAVANASSSPFALNFALSFTNPPSMVAALQTAHEADAASPRLLSVGQTSAQAYIQEETSRDAETAHAAEELAYLAFIPDTDITDENGDFVGETGSLNLTNAWAGFSMRHQYTKPIVIFGAASANDASPITIRVKDVTAESFQARLQEWTYQDGTHGVEHVGYVVVEGSIPFDQGYYCGGKPTNLVLNQTVFAHDNCDQQLNFGESVLEEMQPTGLLTTRTWVAVDDCGRTAVTSRNDTCVIAALRLRAILNGPYNNSTGLMRDDLKVKGYLPSQEPYSSLSNFHHKGKGGGEALDANLLQVTGPNSIVDWVFVEIRDSVQSNNVVVTKSALLQRDGDVVAADGNDLLVFPGVPEGKYYVAIRHRNHIGLMTDAPLLLTSLAPPLVDFTEADFGVKGWNEAGKLVGGKRTCWPGDFNGDRKIIYQGPSNDVFTLFARIITDPLNTDNLANFISTGYDRTDLNLDGQTIYQGPNNERATLLYNTIMSHPANSSYLANFIVREYLP